MYTDGLYEIGAFYNAYVETCAKTGKKAKNYFSWMLAMMTDKLD